MDYLRPIECPNGFAKYFKCKCQAVGIPALLIGLALAVVFFLLGVFFWKVTVAAIRKLGEGRHKLQYMD